MRKQPRLRASSSARRSSAVPTPGSASPFGDDDVVHPGLRPVIAEALVVLHVDDARRSRRRAPPPASRCRSAAGARRTPADAWGPRRCRPRRHGPVRRAGLPRPASPGGDARRTTTRTPSEEERAPGSGPANIAPSASSEGSSASSSPSRTASCTRRNPLNNDESVPMSDRCWVVAPACRARRVAEPPRTSIRHGPVFSGQRSSSTVITASTSIGG